jgi:hypothetical protein
MGTQTTDFIRALAIEHRIIVIGGLAVIAHGYNRPTKDADIWADPLDSANHWADRLHRFLGNYPDLSIHTLPGWRKISTPSEIALAAEEVGMIRINGLNCPLDIFRRPNEFPEDSFDDVYFRGTAGEDGSHLPDPLDLIVTKMNTGRAQDFQDAQHLESLVRKHYAEVLPSASLAEVKALFDRFLDWQVCEQALKNPSQEVKDYTLSCLEEMASEGDPFSLAILESRPIPYTHFPQLP